MLLPLPHEAISGPHSLKATPTQEQEEGGGQACGREPLAACGHLHLITQLCPHASSITYYIHDLWANC